MPVTKRELKAESDNLDKLKYAREVALKLFGDRTNLTDLATIKEIDEYLETCDDDEAEKEFAVDLQRAINYACEFFGTDKPTPMQTFFCLERVILRDEMNEDEDEDEEDDEE